MGFWIFCQLKSCLIGILNIYNALAVCALSTLLDIGFDLFRVSRDVGDVESYYEEIVKAGISIVKSFVDVVSDGSPLVRTEVVGGML